MEQNKIIRSFWRAVKIETAQSPYNVLHFKLFYPALSLKKSGEHNIIPDPTQAPYPVIIFFNGVNCDLGGYEWLAIKLSEQGLVVIVFNFVENNSLGIFLSAGVDLKAWRNNYGNVPTSLTLPPLLAELKYLQSDSELAGMLDLQKIILGGHSAGGRLALENAQPSFFPEVVAAFAYGAHSGGFVQFGFEPATILPLPSSLPMLVIGGTCDGVIANSSSRYGIEKWETPVTPIERTFEEAILGNRNDAYLLIIEGANHFSIVNPLNSTKGRAFLDFATTQPESLIQSLIVETIALFIDAHVRSLSKAAQKLNQLLEDDNPLIASFKRK